MIINPSQAHLQITVSPAEFTLLRRAMFMYGLAAISEAKADDLELIEEMNKVLDNVDNVDKDLIIRKDLWKEEFDGVKLPPFIPSDDYLQLERMPVISKEDLVARHNALQGSDMRIEVMTVQEFKNKYGE